MSLFNVCMYAFSSNKIVQQTLCKAHQQIDLTVVSTDTVNSSARIFGHLARQLYLSSIMQVYCFLCTRNPEGHQKQLFQLLQLTSIEI